MLVKAQTCVAMITGSLEPWEEVTEEEPPEFWGWAVCFRWDRLRSISLDFDSASPSLWFWFFFCCCFVFNPSRGGLVVGVVSGHLLLHPSALELVSRGSAVLGSCCHLFVLLFMWQDRHVPTSVSSASGQRWTPNRGRACPAVSRLLPPWRSCGFTLRVPFLDPPLPGRFHHCSQCFPSVDSGCGLASPESRSLRKPLEVAIFVSTHRCFILKCVRCFQSFRCGKHGNMEGPRKWKQSWRRFRKRPVSSINLVYEPVRYIKYLLINEQMNCKIVWRETRVICFHYLLIYESPPC